jgi:hypothetical protein
MRYIQRQPNSFRKTALASIVAGLIILGSYTYATSQLDSSDSLALKETPAKHECMLEPMNAQFTNGDALPAGLALFRKMPQGNSGEECQGQLVAQRTGHIADGIYYVTHDFVEAFPVPMLFDVVIVEDGNARVGNSMGFTEDHPLLAVYSYQSLKSDVHNQVASPFLSQKECDVIVPEVPTETKDGWELNVGWESTKDGKRFDGWKCMASEEPLGEGEFVGSIDPQGCMKVNVTDDIVYHITCTDIDSLRGDTDSDSVAVEVVDSPCDFGISTRFAIFEKQGEMNTSLVTVVTQGDQSPGLVDFSTLNNTEIAEGVTMTFNPLSCNPGTESCTVNMTLSVAPDAPVSPTAIVVNLSAHSETCGMSRTKPFLFKVVGRSASIDLTIDGSDGPAKYSRNASGNLVATIRLAEGKSFEGLLEWKSRDTSGNVFCEASQANGNGFEGEREPAGSEVVRGITTDDTFRIACQDANGPFSDSVEVRVIGLDPTFEEF